MILQKESKLCIIANFEAIDENQMTKYNQNYLDKIENIYKEAGYTIRYEKGNFKSGQCVLEEQKIVVVNKFSPLVSKIEFLAETLKTLQIDKSQLQPASVKLYEELKQTEIKF